MARKNVGVFYHPVFKTQGYVTFRDRLRDFPGALNELLKQPHIKLYQCPRVSLDLLLKVHAREMIIRADLEDAGATAYESVGGVVAAMEALARGELERAFCFVGVGGHHAGSRDFFDDSCFNDVMVAVTHVRELSPWRRFAVVDTDAHHAGGTLELLGEDAEVLHLCFCRSNYQSLDGKAIEINVYRQEEQADSHSWYLDQVRRHLPLVQEFSPELLIWYFGFDTHRDEAASLGLTEETYFGICDLLTALANKAGIPLLVVLGGGSLHYVASAAIPEIIRRLGEG
ncbi:MAG: histone deacetylase [Thermodesulfobacteriota bacterium]